MLVDQRTTPRLAHFSLDLAVVDRWIPKKTYMGQLEIYAGPVSLATWGALLQGHHVLHFVDNDSASASLVRGYSPKADSCELVGLYWLSAAKHRVAIYIDRVESKSNLSDGPSRFDCDLLVRLGSVPVEPVVPGDLALETVHTWFQPDAARAVPVPASAQRTSERPAPSERAQHH